MADGRDRLEPGRVRCAFSQGQVTAAIGKARRRNSLGGSEEAEAAGCAESFRQSQNVGRALGLVSH
jgi:hypothetical protein